ncbi:MAG: histidine utilization repressor [Salinarimonas sp.]
MTSQPSRLPHTAGPLYDRVKRWILGRIARGEWRAEARLPSEHDLVAELGVSRMTVHRALRELTNAGVLTRIQGVGTFVAPPQIHAAAMEVRDIAAEIRARGHVHAAEVVTLEAAPPPDDVRERFGPGAYARLYHSVVVHAENGVPVQVEERWVDPGLAPAYLAQDFTRTTAHAFLQACAPLTEVEHVISAARADAATAAHLALRTGDPVLLLRCRTWFGATVASVARLTYPGERYALVDRRVPGRAG